jgi:hypothetical protein
MTKAERREISRRIIAHATMRTDGPHLVSVGCRCAQCERLRERLKADKNDFASAKRGDV